MRFNKRFLGVHDKHILNLSLNEWKDECYENAKNKGWEWTEDQKKDVNFLSAQLMLIVSECSEALEDIRKFGAIDLDTKYKKQPEYYHDEQDYIDNLPLYKPVGFKTEIADILIRVLHLCGELNIDIEEEVAIKLEYNMTRSFRHGNKTL